MRFATPEGLSLAMLANPSTAICFRTVRRVLSAIKLLGLRNKRSSSALLNVSETAQLECGVYSCCRTQREIIMKLTLSLWCFIFVTHGSFAQNAKKLKMPGPDVQNFMLGTWSTQTTYAPSSEMPNGGAAGGIEVWRPGPGGMSVMKESRTKKQK